MSYELVWSPRSKKMLKKLENKQIIRIIKKMEKVAISPYDFLEKIGGEEGYKVRVGDYRVFVDLNKDKHAIEVLTVRHRRHAYKNK